MSGKVLKVVTIDENGAQKMDIDSDSLGQLHNIIAKAVGEEALNGAERPHPMDNPEFLKMLQHIEEAVLSRLLRAPEDTIKKFIADYESVSKEAGLTKEEQAAFKDFLKDLEKKLLAQSEQQDEAFSVSLTEEQALDHMAELVKLKRGAHVQLIKKDLTTVHGFFLGIPLGSKESSGIAFLNYRNGKIFQGFAPYHCVLTEVTAGLLEKLRAWKESKPDFVKE